METEQRTLKTDTNYEAGTSQTTLFINENNAQNDRRSSADTNSIDIGEIIETPDAELMSTSAVLFYCKSKILYPYLKLLAFMGLRPVSLDQMQNSKILLLLSHYHTLQITALVCLGYVLQYMSCFRRDRGFYHRNYTSTFFFNFTSEDMELCHGSSFFSHTIPSVLHFSGFLYAIYLFRISDNEHLQNLIERVFLLSSFPPQGMYYTSPKRLLKTLWVYIILSLLWMGFSLFIVYIMVYENRIEFQWTAGRSDSVKFVLKLLLIICTFTHDMVQATVITNYCLQAQLLTAHLHFLRNRLLTRTISTLDWMREISEFKKLLHHFNELIAPGVCLFVIVNVCWMCSGIVWLTNLDRTDVYLFSISEQNVPNEILWILATIVPFVSAARLTAACTITKRVGHDIIVRPFLHQETPQDDLNAVLLYACSLRLSAKLFRFPVTGKLLCLISAVIGVAVTVAGMCHYVG